MDFSTLTLKDLSESIPDAGSEWLKSNRAFYHGDHWQDGAGWAGPMPDTTHPIYRDLILEIERGFVSKNTVAEVVNRHTAGVIGLEPAWSLAVRRPLSQGQQPTTAEQSLIDEAETLLTGWWDNRRILQILQDATATCLWGQRGPLRLFVPSGSLRPDEAAGQVVPVADLQTSVMRIYLDQPDPAQAAVILDRETMQEAGVYLYEKDRQKYAEITYLDSFGNTIIRIVSAEVDRAVALPLDGHLMINELHRERLITDQVVQNQKALNLGLTMLSRNVVMAGFLERTYLNAQLPGRMEADPYRPGEERFVPEPLHVGAGATNFISGVTTLDANGNEVLATPSLIYRDPVPVTTFRDTKQEAYQTILEECQQLHALLSGDAAASGESRKQALTDFKNSLSDTKAQLEEVTRWLLETVLSLAAVFSGQPGRYSDLRAVVECRLDLGPVTADDKRVAKEMVEAEIISRETARGWVGVDDPDAEAAIIETEQGAISQRNQQALATAVLNAQRSLAGGGSSNGLEQPVANGQ